MNHIHVPIYVQSDVRTSGKTEGRTQDMYFTKTCVPIQYYYNTFGHIRPKCLKMLENFQKSHNQFGMPRKTPRKNIESNNQYKITIGSENLT